MISKNKKIEVIMTVCLLAGAFFLFACGTRRQGSYSEVHTESSAEETEEQLVDERLVGYKIVLDEYEIIGLEKILKKDFF